MSGITTSVGSCPVASGIPEIVDRNHPPMLPHAFSPGSPAAVGSSPGFPRNRSGPPLLTSERAGCQRPERELRGVDLREPPAATPGPPRRYLPPALAIATRSPRWRPQRGPGKDLKTLRPPALDSGWQFENPEGPPAPSVRRRVEPPQEIGSRLLPAPPPARAPLAVILEETTCAGKSRSHQGQASNCSQVRSSSVGSIPHSSNGAAGGSPPENM